MKFRGLCAATILLATAWPAPGQTALAPPRKVYALIVGGNEFADAGSQWLKFAGRDASLFNTYLQEKQARNPGAFETVLLVNANATRTKILDALNTFQRKAGRGDDVYLFFSTTGRATPVSQEGFIGTYEGHGENPDTTVRVSDLRKFLLNCDARRIFLFADVSREQPVNGMDNRINLALRDLRKYKSELWGVLSTEPSTASVESKDLEGGHGLFGYFLVRGLQGGNRQYPYSASGQSTGGQIGFDRLYGYLVQHVPNYSAQVANRAQKPMPVNKIAPLALMPNAPGEPAGRWDLRPLRMPLLIAQAGPLPPSLLIAQAGPLRPDVPAPALDSGTRRLLDRFTDEVAAGNMLAADGVSGMLELLRARVPSVADEESRHVLSVAFEDAGQHIVAQYGTGDQFPEDPRKLTAAHFALGQKLFAEARALREEEAAGVGLTSLCNGAVQVRNRPDVRSLEARRQFCSARSILADEMRRASAGLAALDQAGRLLNCAVELDPQLPEPKNALGIVELLGAHFDLAISHFSDAKALAPDWAYPRHNLALAYIEKGRNVEAEREYREAITRTPYYPYLYYNLGLLLQRQNRKQPADQAYRDALRMFDQQIARYRTREGQLRAIGEQKRADFNLQVAEVLVRNKAEAENALGALEQDRGRLRAAEDRFRAALALNQGLSPARHNLALVLYAQSGRAAEARRLWQDNVDRDPAFHPSRLKLAEAYLADNELGKAEEHYGAVLAANAENTEARLGLASALARNENPSEALQILQQATAAQKADPRLLTGLGDLYRKQGDNVAACSQWEKAAGAAKNSVIGDRGELRRKLKLCDGVPRR